MPSSGLSGANEPRQPASITLVSHSMLLYWWPVWVVGLLLGSLSLLGGSRLALLPGSTRLAVGSTENDTQTFELIVPKDQAQALLTAAQAPQGQAFTVPAAPGRISGLVFCLVLLGVVFATTISLRGFWSVFAIVVVLLLVGVIDLLGFWDTLFGAFLRMHIYISAAGYLFLATALLVLWLVTVFIFDQKRYVTFTSGQIVVHQEIGDARQVYDTINVVLQKQRNDFFRHTLLGFGSGDVLLDVPGGGRQLLLPNVLFADSKIQQVADLMKTRPIISESPV